MERISFRDHHLIAFLKNWTRGPLDQAWGDYLRQHKSIGAHDRKAMGQLLFGMVRWKGLLDLFCPSEDPAQRLSTFRGLDLNRCSQDASLPEHIRLGLPLFLYDRFLAVFGPEETRRLGRVLNTEAPLTIRANALKIDREALRQKLSDRWPAIETCRDAPHGLQFEGRPPLFATPEFKEGLFEMQDEGSQLVADWVDPKPKDQVLDFCSGSGGKTLGFAHKMGGKGQIFLHDIRSSVLIEAKKRLKRAGIQNAQCLEPKHKQLSALKTKLDWVLADVPCSGSGAIRRNPDAKWGIDSFSVERLIAEQRAIAKDAVEYLKPGGYFVYATCSILPEENETQVAYFLQTLPLELAKPTLTLLPEKGGRDGFFVALFRKQKA